MSGDCSRQKVLYFCECWFISIKMTGPEFDAVLCITSVCESIFIRVHVSQAQEKSVRKLLKNENILSFFNLRLCTAGEETFACRCFRRSHAFAGCNAEAGGKFSPGCVVGLAGGQRHAAFCRAFLCGLPPVVDFNLSQEG